MIALPGQQGIYTGWNTTYLIERYYLRIRTGHGDVREAR